MGLYRPLAHKDVVHRSHNITTLGWQPDTYTMYAPVECALRTALPALWACFAAMGAACVTIGGVIAHQFRP